MCWRRIDGSLQTAGQLRLSSGQLPVATASAGVSCQSVTDWYRHFSPSRPPPQHSRTSTSILQFLQILHLPPSPESGSCLVGTFERLDRKAWKSGCEPPSRLWPPVLQAAPLSPSLCCSFSFICFSHVTYNTVISSAYHLARGKLLLPAPVSLFSSLIYSESSPHLESFISRKVRSRSRT